MSSGTLYRWSGLILLIGGLLTAVSSLVEAVLYPGFNQTPEQILSAPWLLLQFVFLTGFLLVAMGFPGSYLLQAARAGRLGFAGFVLLWVGVLLGGVGFAAILTAVFPWVAQSAPALVTANPPLVGFLLLVIGPALLLAVGSILLGIVTLRARVFPRWLGMLLLCAGFISVVALPLPPSTITNIVMLVGNLALFLAFAWFGYALVTQGKETMTAPSLAKPAAQTSS